MGVLRGSERPSTRRAARFVVLAVSLAAFGIDSSLCQEVPQFQPWPPPAPSETRVGPKHTGPRDPAAATRTNVASPTDKPLPQDGPTLQLLGDVQRSLASALNSDGWSEIKYYGAPGGFAVLARCHRTKFEGWRGYLNELFKGEPGPYSRVTHLRFVLLIVTDTPPATVEQGVTFNNLTAWHSRGLLGLPQSIDGQPYAPGTTCYALAYVFDPGQDSSGAPPRLLNNLAGPMQSVNAELWAALGKSPCTPR